MRKLESIALVLLIAAGVLLAQRGTRSGFGGRSYGRGRAFEDVRTPREIPQHGNETPNWTNPPGFEQEVFTFVRIKRDSTGYGYGSGGPWSTDAPDSDLNLSYRLQQMSALKVNPDGLFLRLTDPELGSHPFIYMVEPGSLYLSDEEVTALRKYLLNGGFLMLDDFWGERQWANMAGVMKRVFPQREFVELPLDHKLYHCVFEITSKGQVPNVELGTESQFTGVTWEYHDGEQCKEVHHRVITDDKGRIMVIATHNTDNGDGWEWEGDNHYFFEHFSEKISYPLAVNIIFYSMTH
jgi:hypothetical protein